MTEQSTCIRQGRKHSGWHKATWWTAAILLAAAIGFGCVSHYSRGAESDSKTHHGFFAAGTDPTELAKSVDAALDHVDATPEQRAQAKAIVARHAPRLRQLQQERQAVQQRLQQLWDDDKIDVQAITAARARCERLAGETTREGLEFMDQLMRVLTVEQRREVVARWKEHAA
jgi:Spy/CpxP family protein refolding chaperone